uniref:Integrator complex subunit 6-like beta-barrel domain-containing protein n=1 Tax=Caenorhabditis japonica TaxID=281687 RepID=A0A8R1DW43_CAEJA
MSTRAHPKFSFFDYAKNYIEMFIKTLSEKNPGLVIDELKKLILPYGSSPVHQAILDAFRALHVNRAQTGIDGYGTGRAPQNSEQVVIILLTDASGVASIPPDFKVFRIPSTPYRLTNSQLLTIDIDMPNIERLCANTGGRSFSIVSVRQITTSIDYILSTIMQHKIGVRFDCLPAIQNKINIAHQFSPQIRPEVPTDKLELEPGPVTEIIMEMLAGRRDYTVWTYIEGASHGPTAPFGCLRLNTTGTGITLVLLPYNFPHFYPLVDEILKEPHLNQSQVWKQKLDSYFQTVPFYYFNQMRTTMEKLKVKAEISGSMSSMYTGQLLSTLNRLKSKAKDEWDQVGIASKLSEAKQPKMLNPSIRIERITSRSCIVGLANDDDDNEEEPLEGMDLTPIYAGDFQIPLYPPIVGEPELDTVYKTPLSSSIENMVSKLNRIQANIDLMFDPEKPTLLDMAKLGAKPRFNTLEELHNMPLKTMGEYEPYQAARSKFYGAPFKRIEEEKERTHAFGNPYKLKGMGGIDEVMDSAIVDANSKSEGKRFGENRHQGGGPPKRRRGPLGIDAFDNWRTRRSMRGSSVASDISEDISSVLSDIGSSDDVILDDMPGTSSSSSSGADRATTPVSELEGMTVKNGASIQEREKEMDSTDTLQENNFETVSKRKEDGTEQESEEQEEKLDLDPLSKQEMMTRKIRIGSIVRQPANYRAFEQIVSLTAGIALESTQILMRYAMRESQRFKIKELTKRLEDRLSAL